LLIMLHVARHFLNEDNQLSVGSGGNKSYLGVWRDIKFETFIKFKPRVTSYWLIQYIQENVL